MTATSLNNGTPAATAPWNNPAAKPLVSLRGLKKFYGDVAAVESLDLDIYPGELFSLLGPSGCGKTTLLRMIAGFEAPSEGQILIDGVDMAAVPAYDRPVNTVFQSYALFPHMTVAQNIAYGLKQDGLSRAEIRDRVQNALALVRLDGFEKRKPDRMSGGQRQRVALARALVKRPKLLLLDEPLAALDKKLREQTQFELVNIQEKIGVTFIMVTHDQEEAMTMSSRIAVMNRGFIEQVGTPYDVYEFPTNTYVADFVGAANLFSGTVSGATGNVLHITSPAFPSPFAVEHDTALPNGTPVNVMVRPEKFTVSRQAPDNGQNALEGTVKEIAYLGDMSVYHTELADGQRVEVSLTNARHNLEERPSWEDRIWLTFHPANAVVLSQ